MNWKTFVLSIVLFDFLALTGYAISEVGYIGIVASNFTNWGGVQVLTDLVIACTLAVIWMISDARAQRTNPWPFVVITLFAGSIGPLMYLLRREWGARPGIRAGLSQT